MKNSQRLFQMSKPQNYKPAVQRYSATHPDEVKALTVLYLGIQSLDNNEGFAEYQQKISELMDGEYAPVLFDFAHYCDPQNFETRFAVAYWYEQSNYEQWKLRDDVSGWWVSEERVNGNAGYFWEAFTSSIDHNETVAFREYIRGASACPMSQIAPVDECGYWGSARDRIPVSAQEALDSKIPSLIKQGRAESEHNRLFIDTPANLVLIRSGVSWANCGDEQLESYNTNLKPVLNKGMEYLRQNPIETGCCCMRQVDALSKNNQAMSENYCAGYFLSLKHLENWAKEHPTHLAIFGKAQNERIKYGDGLELRTYHEVFVIDQPSCFEYVNCHPETGLLPYFAT